MAKDNTSPLRLINRDMELLIHHSITTQIYPSEKLYRNLIDLELLTLAYTADGEMAEVYLTSRGKYLVNYWQNVPLPVLTQEWVIPK